jgi:thiosulfate dehydrogenase (quinone) large subunit
MTTIGRSPAAHLERVEAPGSILTLAAATVIMMAFMWAAEWPIASGSSNPVTDYHFIYAVVGIVLALTYAGHTWGLGRQWATLPLVQKNRWLI